MKKLYFMIFLTLVIITSVGCSKKANNSGKGTAIDFTVVDEINIPNELKEIIDGKKKDSFQLTFTSGESMYFAIGYGEQATGGYSIKVDNLYMAEDGIHIETNLLGPEKGETISKKPSYPYITVKIKAVEADVTYE